MDIDHALALAVEQAQRGLSEDGLPIGSTLLVRGELAASGRNRREQQQDSVAHAELDCLRNAGLLPAADYADAVLLSTLSPCWMCAGAARLYGVRRIVVADEGLDVPGQEDWRASGEFFEQAGIAYELRADDEMIRLFRDFLRDRPQQWSGDVGQ